MKKLLTLVLTLAGMAVLTSSVAAQESREAAPQGPTLSCCKCLGDQTTLNLSTGQGSPTDPFWTVNGSSPTYTTPKVASWISLAGANWIQPVGPPTPNPNVPQGVYRYTVKFFIPRCVIPSDITLEGKFSADNGAKAWLDSPGNGVGSCPGPTCFKTSAPLTVTSGMLTSNAWHTLGIDVTNNESYSGLIVNAILTRHCVKGP